MQRARSIPLLLITILFLLAPIVARAGEITLYFPPEWKAKAPKAKAIAEALSVTGGSTVRPVVVESYPDILSAFTRNQPMLVYAGSFLQALLYARGLATPIVQAVDGKEFYTSVLIAPASAGTDAKLIVRNAGASVAYAKGTSSGESGAKAATGGIAAMAKKDHISAVSDVDTGKAKCAFVKDWWWNSYKQLFKGMNQLTYPGVSDQKNPDNILSASKALPANDIRAVKTAALKNPKVFQVTSFKEFDPALLEPTLLLMKKGSINPKTYTW